MSERRECMHACTCACEFCVRMQRWWVWLGGCGRGVPLPPQLGVMGAHCKLPHRGLERSPRSFATLLYSNHETR